MNTTSQSAKKSACRSSVVRQFSGECTQVLKTAADNALKAALTLPQRSIQP